MAPLTITPEQHERESNARYNRINNLLNAECESNINSTYVAIDDAFYDGRWIFVCTVYGVSDNVNEGYISQYLCLSSEKVTQYAKRVVTDTTRLHVRYEFHSKHCDDFRVAFHNTHWKRICDENGLGYDADDDEDDYNDQ